MDIRFTVHCGSLEVEVEGADDEDYQTELLEILDFIEEHEGRLMDLQQSSIDQPPDVESKQSTVTTFWDDSSDERNSSEEAVDGPIVAFANKLNMDTDQLTVVIDIDPAGEELPFIIPEMTDLADTRQERQFRAALMLLATWQDCYDKDRMKSSDLKDALEYSGIDSDQLSTMYRDINEADSYFDRQGRGRSATVALTRPGIREGRNQILSLLE